MFYEETEYSNTFSEKKILKEEKKKAYTKCIFPVTCYIINQCTSANYESKASMHEYEHLRFCEFSLVGILRSEPCKSKDNYIGYRVDDMTGQVFVKLSLGEKTEPNGDGEDEVMHDEGVPRDEFKLPDVVKNEYVRVIGYISSDSNGKRYVEALNINKIKSLNEITHHILRCIQASIDVYKKLNKEDDMDFLHNKVTTNQPRLSTMLRDNDTNGLNDFQKQIIKILKANQKKEGVHINDLCEYYKMPYEKVKRIMEDLTDRSLVFSTIDLDHFKSI